MRRNLPAESGLVPAETVEKTAASSGLGWRVLVLEDEFLIALDLKSALEEFGYVCVGPACNEEQALRVLEDTLVDAALLDVNLGTGTSLAVGAALLERNVPFAFVSGYDLGVLPSAFAGVLLLKKPFSRSELRQVLHSLAGAAER